MALSESKDIDVSIYEITTEDLKRLAEKAIEAKSHAYCPYSDFRVGAALLLTNGTIFSGSNVECASTPVGICAERCALAPCVASLARPQMPKIRALAVSTDIMPPASPCGMCRQYIREFCEPEMKIFMFGGRKKKLDSKEGGGEQEEQPWEEAMKRMQVRTLGELLPMSFGPGDLHRFD